MFWVVIFWKVNIKISKKGPSSFELRAVILRIQCEYVNYLCLIRDPGSTGEGCVLRPHIRCAKRKIRLQTQPPVKLPTDSRCCTLVGQNGRQTPSLSAGHLVSLPKMVASLGGSCYFSPLHPTLNLNTTHWPYTTQYSMLYAIWPLTGWHANWRYRNERGQDMECITFYSIHIFSSP